MGVNEPLKPSISHESSSSREISDPPPLPNAISFRNKMPGVASGRNIPVTGDTSGRNIPVTPGVISGRNTPVTNAAVTGVPNQTYVEFMRLQRSLAEGDAVFEPITNKRNTFNKALWLHVWPYTKLILVPDFSFKNPDFVGEMSNRATVTNNCAIQMCEACLEFLGKRIALEHQSITDLVTFWQTHSSLVKKTFVDIRNSVVDGMKSSFVKDYLQQNNEFVNYVQNIGTECPEFDEKRTEFQNFLIYSQYKWNKGESLTTYRKDMMDERLGMIAKQAFVYFLECFGSKTVRKRVYFEQVKRMKVSEILTESDEAFACVAVELGFSLWSRAGRREIVISKETRYRPSFRKSYEPKGRTLSLTKSIYDTLTCATYYNRAYKEVESSRLLDVSLKFEDEYFSKKNSLVKSRKKQRQVYEGDVISGYYIAVHGIKKKRTYYA